MARRCCLCGVYLVDGCGCRCGEGQSDEVQRNCRNPVHMRDEASRTGEDYRFEERSRHQYQRRFEC